jgi:glycosyltransferase involved in cell wall biosynthesis
MPPENGPRKAFWLPNAVAVEDFPPAAQPSGPARRVGYVGALAHWIDAEAIERAARTLRDWTFELAGRVESPAVERLRALPNVRLRGEIPYAQVPAFLARLHALFIPFVDSPLTRAVDAVKLYEAMAVGVPVVAPALPEVARWPAPLVELYPDRDSLASVLTAAVTADSPELRRARRAAVIEETWAARANRLTRAVADLAGNAR